MGAIKQQTNPYFCQLREFAVGGHVKCFPGNFGFSGTYATGGDTFNCATAGAGQKGKLIVIDDVLSDSGTYRIEFVRVDNNNMKAIVTVRATGAEVANGTDLTAQTFTTMVYFVP